MSYEALAADLRAVADEHAARQAFGASLGAGTLLRLLSQTPDRFARVVLFLPAALDSPPPGLVRRSRPLLDALTSREPAAVEACVRAELAPGVSGATVEAYVRARTQHLLASDLVPLLRSLGQDRPVTSRASLRAVTADVLVIAQEGDDVHSSSVAEEISQALPRAELVVFGAPGVVFREGERLRSLIRTRLGLDLVQ